MSKPSKKQNKNLSVVSLFTGAGGLDLGLEAANFSVRLCVEKDSNCRNTLKKNRPNWKLSYPENIHDMQPNDFLHQAKLKRGELVLLAGGPPCQPFSKAGYWVNGDSARLKDPRANALVVFMNVVETMLPLCILIENVKGLGYKNKSEGLNLIRRKLKSINKKHGVNYVPNVIHINAADYGVPQIRERIFVIAHRTGKHFCLPERTHCNHQKCKELKCKLKRYTTAWDAIGHLDSTNWHKDLDLSGKWADLLPSIPEGKNYLWHTSKSEGASLFGWRTRYWSFLLKLAKRTPSWTIQAEPGPSTGPFHWRNRQLSIEELSRLQTFPKGYTLVGDRRSCYRQIGNAVPSAIGELLGIAIRKQFLGEILNCKLSLLPSHRRYCPGPEPLAPLQKKFYHLNGDHKDHPGVGRGPLASVR